MNEEEIRASERAKIVWWLRACADGPVRARMRLEAAVVKEVADAIEQHPDRFAGAPG